MHISKYQRCSSIHTYLGRAALQQLRLRWGVHKSANSRVGGVARLQEEALEDAVSGRGRVELD